MIDLAAGDAAAAVDPERGGRLASLSVQGVELLVGPGPDRDHTHWGCFPMAPWAGRLREGRVAWRGRVHQLERTLPPHAIHGTVTDRAWAVRASDPGSAELEADLRPGWPWPGRVEHTVRLFPDRLELRLAVRAEDEPFPASCGWHPWFRRPVALDLRARSLRLRDPSGIPTGELAPAPASLDGLDDCLTGLAGPPRLRRPEGVEVELRSPCDDWVVFTEPEHALCVEPQTAPPDAPNQQPRAVTPDDPLEATFTLAW